MKHLLHTLRETPIQGGRPTILSALPILSTRRTLEALLKLRP
jgi:hypothetical protein